jgi:hypothetical protein
MLLRVRCEDLRALPVGELGGFAFVPVHTQMRRFVTFVAEEIHAIRARPQDRRHRIQYRTGGRYGGSSHGGRERPFRHAIAEAARLTDFGDDAEIGKRISLSAAEYVRELPKPNTSCRVSEVRARLRRQRHAKHHKRTATSIKWPHFEPDI